MRLIYIVFLILNSLVLSSQETFWIRFIDKNENDYSIDRPEEFLSQRSIERRNNQGISLSIQDLPVSRTYINQLSNVPGVTIKSSSKWFNSVSIIVAPGFDLSPVLDLNFVDKVETITQYHVQDSPEGSNKKSTLDNIVNLTYGQSFNQINLIKGLDLHSKGFLGEGMLIAVMDGGFTGLDQFDGFASLRNENRIVDTWNYVDEDENVYQYSTHGTMVMSCMATNISGEYLGTAPKAQYALYLTENVASETLFEEDNWIRSAERADSIGADICNTSLGYTTMDDGTQSHIYDQLDGNTLSISIAADIAASKGMLMINSAGNSGASPWYYIGAPADADSVLAIGACDVDGQMASFSSHGPSSDGDVKPNITGPGWNVAVYSSNGIFASSGTSFAAPIISGMSACLWQANSDKTNMEVFNALQESAHLFDFPNPDFGHGIPNYELASGLLGQSMDEGDEEEDDNVFEDDNVTSIPNDVEIHVYLGEDLMISLFNESLLGEVSIEVVNIKGQVIASKDFFVGENSVNTYKLMNGLNLSSSLYFLRVYNEEVSVVRKFIKW